MQITLLRDYHELIHVSPHSKKSPSSNDLRNADKENQPPNLNLRSKIFELSSILEVAKVCFCKFYLEEWMIANFLIRRCAWFMKHWSQSIQRFIYLKWNRINGNFWLIHSPNISECASPIWVYHIGNCVLHKHAVYHHGLNNCFCYWHRIYWNTITSTHIGIVYCQIEKSRSFITKLICPYSAQKPNVRNKRIIANSINRDGSFTTFSRLRSFTLTLVTCFHNFVKFISTNEIIHQNKKKIANPYQKSKHSNRAIFRKYLKLNVNRQGLVWLRCSALRARHSNNHNRYAQHIRANVQILYTIHVSVVQELGV